MFVKVVSSRYTFSVQRQLYEVLTRITRVLQAEERATTAGLLPVQLHALEYLARCNRYSDRPAAVAEYLQVTKGTASQTLRVLERRGLIDKRRDGQDGRVVRLRPTSKGRRLLQRTTPPPPVEAALAGLTKSEEAGLQKSLEVLLRGLQKANDSRSFGVCHTCRHFLREDAGSFRCALTSERLSTSDSSLICREHELAE